MNKIRNLLFSILVGLFSFVVQAEGVIDINSSDADTIALELKGIGLSKAREIVKYRVEHGPFQSVDELIYVKGIGSKTLARIRNQLSVGQIDPLE